jgi:GntR family transcriptional repressor for pyruvate dehydrogenase complex
LSRNVAQFSPAPAGRALEHVVNELQRAISNGDLVPGQRLPAEPQLAVQLGVSRSALREALKALELSGYLKVRRGYGGGTFIAAAEPAEFRVVPAPAIPTLRVSLRELAEVRAAFEPAAAALCAPARFDRLVALHGCNRDLRDQPHNPGRILASVVQFHMALAHACGNPVFVAVLEGLRPLMYRSMKDNARLVTWRAMCQEDHEAIVNHIASGAAELAAQLMRVHVAREVDGE